MTKEEKEAKAAAEKAAGAGDPDQEFWDSEKITDDDEKEAIKGRARAYRYHEYRKSLKEKEEGTSKGKKKWFEKD